MMKMEPKLRKFPYPYKAALSVANDLDNMSWEDFCEVRKFLNTEMDTLMGRGVGLEIGDTFWFYSLLPNQVSYFRGVSDKRFPYSGLLLEMAKAGYLDCLHSYGDFSRWENPSNPIYFNRKLAERAVEEALKNGVYFDTYINHGDNFNIQNIFLQLIRAEGDNPKSEAYHTDLTIDELGVRFYWSGELSAVVGQDRKLRFDDYDYHLFRSGHLLKNIAKTALRMNHRKRKVFGNELSRLVVLRDGRHIMDFTRYCYKYAYIYTPPGRGVLKIQLSDKVLNRLEKTAGYMIIYTHFGQPPKRGSRGLFDEELISLFKALKKRNADGKLWITTTSRVLRYNYTHKYLKWSVNRDDSGATIIDIEGVGGPINIEPFYQGLTFYCSEPRKAVIRIGGRKVENLIINDKDESGFKSVSIPMNSLEFPADVLNCRDYSS